MIFEKLAIHIEGLSNGFHIKCFISGLKETIQERVWGIHPPNYLESCQQDIEEETILNAHNPFSAFITKSRPVAMSNPSPPLKEHHLSLEEMVNRKQKGLYYNDDEKYVKGHYCREQRLF